MFKKKFIFSIIIFIFFMLITSFIKNQTRDVEKKIYKIDNEIYKLKKDLHEIQLDFYYLSSPEILSLKIGEFSEENYVAMDHSKIYFDLEEFLLEKYKLTKTDSEKKIKK